MKSILVIDTPDSCSECPICVTSTIFPMEHWCPGVKNRCVNLDSKPEWCPLKPLPTKYNMVDIVFDRDYDGEYEYGYNACINEILWGVDRWKNI